MITIHTTNEYIETTLEHYAGNLDGCTFTELKQTAKEQGVTVKGRQSKANYIAAFVETRKAQLLKQQEEEMHQEAKAEAQRRCIAEQKMMRVIRTDEEHGAIWYVGTSEDFKMEHPEEGCIILYTYHPEDYAQQPASEEQVSEPVVEAEQEVQEHPTPELTFTVGTTTYHYGDKVQVIDEKSIHYGQVYPIININFYRGGDSFLLDGACAVIAMKPEQIAPVPSREARIATIQAEIAQIEARQAELAQEQAQLQEAMVSLLERLQGILAQDEHHNCGDGCLACAEFEKMCEAQYRFAYNLGTFFQALAMIASQEVDIFVPEMDMEHYELWLRTNGMYQDWLKIIPIGDEYCWTHKPGGWCCPQCYYEQTLVVIDAMRQAVQEVPSYVEVQAAQFASETIVVRRDCPSCGFTRCPSCDACHSLHCEEGKLRSIDCGEAMDVLASVQRGERMLV